MERCIGIISGANIESSFGPLCIHRPVSMLPFGGRYRLIDFAVSNMVNHDIKTIAIFTGEKIRSIMDHLGDGKPWDLNRRFSGLYLFPPVTTELTKNRDSDIAQFYSAIDFFEQTREKYLLLMQPNIIAKVDLTSAFKYFKETNADATLFYKKISDPWGKYINSEKMTINDDGSLENIGINLGLEETFNMFLKMGFIKKDVFIKLVMESVEKGNTNYLQEAVIKNKDKLNINTFEFRGHVEDIKNMKSFYDANLSLLKKNVSQDLFYEKGTIFTKTKDEPSTLYTETSDVQNSLVANGCFIEGTVDTSIIFRGVKIGKGAVVKNSIIMQKAEIGENALVVNSILDKEAVVGDGVRIAGSSLMPYVVEKKQVLKKE
ncbi:MAG: glucose-1-phosphate adenylyltransferase subunit GlgD [Gudongella sp.]|nr:glucose-1-phosphate adenylyltransferase subunit GlgD [Gudongella sp.]